jgi:hypothetical protein
MANFEAARFKSNFGTVFGKQAHNQIILTMKKILLFSLLVLGTYISQAQNSNMVFFTDNGEKFYLFLNGAQQNTQAMSNVKVTEMASAPYQVRVQFAVDSLGQIKDKVTLMPNTEKTWRIKPISLEAKSMKKNVAPKKTIAPAERFAIKVLSEVALNTLPPDLPNNNNQTVVVYQPQQATGNVNTTTPNDDNGVNMNMNMGEKGINFNFSVNGQGVGSQTSTSTTTTSTSTSTTHGNQTTTSSSVSGGMTGCANPLSAQRFLLEKKKVTMQKTTAGKLLVAKKLINTQCLLSQQVYEITSLQTFSKDRLTLAKLAYNRVFDPANFEVVFNAFAISADVEQLQAYMESMGGADVVDVNVDGNNNNNNYNNNNSNGNYNQNSGTVYVPGYTGPVGCPYPMNSSNFQAAKQTIEKQTFENTKVQTAKQIVDANCLTADQVTELTKLFDFDNDRLDFAKYAYTHTYDKGNYFKVNNSFEFESSITALQEYIKGK